MAKKKKKNARIDMTVPLEFFKKKSVLVLILSSTLFFMIGIVTKNYMFSGKNFIVENVIVNNVRGYTFDKDKENIREYYHGRNIFTIDLAQAGMMIENNFPHFKQITVRRVLPDTIEVDIVAREPLAVIDSGSGVVIDAEGFVIDVNSNIEKLTEIRGITFFFSLPSKGTVINNKSLEKALTILKGIEEILPMIKKDIDYLDVSDRRNLVLSVTGVEIKMGESNFLRKLKKLREITQDPDIDITDMNYIDLRFEDAVLSPK
ncbi:MAG: cell division protein FtsQ/DivIB [Candidatus Omnitrophota bacterium]